jgi:ABC-type sulfate/molybdate transport systems ATPase subunit
MAVSGGAIASSAQTLSVRVRKQLAEPAATGLAFTLDVQFTAAPGFTILFGASGAGKTTILDCIAGLRRPDTGRIVCGDEVLFDSDPPTDLATRSRQDRGRRRTARSAGPPTVGVSGPISRV